MGCHLTLSNSGGSRLEIDQRPRYLSNVGLELGQDVSKRYVPPRSHGRGRGPRNQQYGYDKFVTAPT